MEASDVIIRGFNSQKNHSTKIVQFQISDANDSERFNCQNILVVEDFQLPKLKQHPTDNIGKCFQINEITLTTLSDLQVEVLIGCDLYSLIVARSVKEGPPNAPTAVETKLGWSIPGPSNRNVHGKFLLSTVRKQRFFGKPTWDPSEMSRKTSFLNADIEGMFMQVDVRAKIAEIFVFFGQTMNLKN